MMENATELFEDEELIDELLEDPIDFKTQRKGNFVKRRKSNQKSAKKQKLSESARKKKKKAQREQLGTSILTFRKSEKRRLKEKRKQAM